MSNNFKCWLAVETDQLLQRNCGSLDIRDIDSIWTLRKQIKLRLAKEIIKCKTKDIN